MVELKLTYGFFFKNQFISSVAFQLITSLQKAIINISKKKKKDRNGQCVCTYENTLSYPYKPSKKERSWAERPPLLIFVGLTTVFIDEACNVGGFNNGG